MEALPRFWVFMYRTTPISYFINPLISTGLAGVPVTCADNEIVSFDPPSAETCGSYLAEYLDSVGGKLLNHDATTSCKMCPVADTDDVLASLEIDFSDRWRNFAITLVYIVVNVGLALLLYWAARVPKGTKRQFRGKAKGA
jgi:ATP-binding cassette, subfamily G (WHITE), member 2, PDR